MLVRSLFALALASSLALPACSQQPPLDVAPNVDLARFQGQWFEIAKLPRGTQTSCTGTTAFYTLRDNGLDLANQCHLGSLTGELKASTMRATVTDSTSKLALDVGGFTGDYWILEVGEHYEYAVVGVPSRDYLWILSRTAKLEQTKLDGILQRASAAKFDTSRLEYTVQAP